MIPPETSIVQWGLDQKIIYSVDNGGGDDCLLEEDLIKFKLKIMIVVIMHFAHKKLYVYSDMTTKKDPDLLYGFKNSNLTLYPFCFLGSNKR
jgi:hypothetical protein